LDEKEKDVEPTASNEDDVGHAESDEKGVILQHKRR
jgi:hypothetical protein